MPIKTTLIAPCGMNCALCLAFQREKNICLGCNGPNKDKSHYCRKCSIKNCEKLARSSSRFCSSSCSSFPCRRLKQLDQRYQNKYGMSMLENLKSIEAKGIRKFVIQEEAKWTCKKCGSLLCVHRESCLNCSGRNKGYPKK
ncbi:DUF3795 domain-containing protein [Patescibacteria group bacterium]|nr:DUF3795 domain-containing protein [Patescibacteria group bacterium]